MFDLAQHDAQVAMPGLLSGGASFDALKRAVHDLVSLAPKDCDVLIFVEDVAVLKARFIKPHTFLFEGIDKNGHHTAIVTHFTQLKARVIYRPKTGPSRWITEMEIIRGRVV